MASQRDKKIPETKQKGFGAMPKSMPKKRVAPKSSANPNKDGGIYFRDVKLGDGYYSQRRTEGSRKGDTFTITDSGQDYYVDPSSKGKKITKLPGESMLGTKRTVLKGGRRESTTTTYKGNPEWNSEVQHNRGSGTRKTGAKNKGY
jgi:hypothetical protein